MVQHSLHLEDDNEEVKRIEDFSDGEEEKHLEVVNNSPEDNCESSPDPLTERPMIEAHADIALKPAEHKQANNYFQAYNDEE